MKIKQAIRGNAGRFFIEDGKAELDFQFPEKNILLITHTEVNESLSGKGIEKQLVSSAVDYAREHSLSIKATCTFAKKVLEKSTEFADVFKPKSSTDA